MMLSKMGWNVCGVKCPESKKFSQTSTIPSTGRAYKRKNTTALGSCGGEKNQQSNSTRNSTNAFTNIDI